MSKGNKRFILITRLIISDTVFAIIFLSKTLGYTQSGGYTSATFLSIDPGARSTAMAGAQAAMIKSIDAIYWNPAVLGSFRGKEISASYLRYLQGINFGNVSAGLPTEQFGNFGLTFTILNSGSINKMNADATDAGSFSTQDLAIGPVWAVNLTHRIFIGSSFKYINQTVDDMSVSGFSFDFGGIYSYLEYLNFGFAMKNLGAGMKDRSLPMSSIFGLAFYPVKELILSAQGDYGFSSPLVGRLGLEYRFSNAFPLRFGYKIAKDDLNSITFGAGFLIQRSYTLDYALGLTGNAGYIHRFTITYHFVEN